jgi:hypothetical protein
MRAASALAIAACAAFGGAAPAAAQIRSIEEQRGGAWLYRAGQARERTACILETDSPAGAAAGGHVRFALLNRPFEFQMSVRDLRWRIPPGATGTVRVEVEGGGVPSGGYASTQRAQQAGPDRLVVDLAPNPDGAARILDALRQGRRLGITMPDGQVVAAGLGGTEPLVRRFLDCFHQRIMPPPAPTRRPGATRPGAGQGGAAPQAREAAGGAAAVPAAAASAARPPGPRNPFGGPAMMTAP